MSGGPASVGTASTNEKTTSNNADQKAISKWRPMTWSLLSSPAGSLMETFRNTELLTASGDGLAQLMKSAVICLLAKSAPTLATATYHRDRVCSTTDRASAGQDAAHRRESHAEEAGRAVQADHKHGYALIHQRD